MNKNFNLLIRIPIAMIFIINSLVGQSTISDPILGEIRYLCINYIQKDICGFHRLNNRLLQKYPAGDYFLSIINIKDINKTKEKSYFFVYSRIVNSNFTYLHFVDIKSDKVIELFSGHVSSDQTSLSKFRKMLNKYYYLFIDYSDIELVSLYINCFFTERAGNFYYKDNVTGWVNIEDYWIIRKRIIEESNILNKNDVNLFYVSNGNLFLYNIIIKRSNRSISFKLQNFSDENKYMLFGNHSTVGSSPVRKKIRIFKKYKY